MHCEYIILSVGCDILFKCSTLSIACFVRGAVYHFLD